ncbi:hypothetical protein LTR36_008895 [Oleoguttula mirabilis]|uniref:C3H1-type domain-containing protein n=1 Tax=Oleoguttula mirabilis TaxID=1507867 RepID=A0AAV9J6Y9_9PEZI|nr:hypothetical protein LTR36_008895 [Oleoguttula mirabilis]
MTEQADLQARIAAIAGRINQRKYQQKTYAPQPPGPWTPYARTTHKNRTLVVNGGWTPAKADQTLATDVPPGSEGLISMRSTNQQLMTKDTYAREQKHKQDIKEQRRAVKRQKRNTEEQHRILRHIDASGVASREMAVEGIRFVLTADGSKLIRVPGRQKYTSKEIDLLNGADSSIASKETPKRAKVAGVEFYRTKHGNLIRASALTGAARPIKKTPQCEHFTKNGTCPYGPCCRFTHDPHKVAICKDFQKHGACPRGDNCDLSHEMTYHRVPACAFFVRGNCTNSACRYPHIHVSPAAPVCRPFATLGFCAKGPECDKRHVIECPDYANHGVCANRESGKCQLPHPDRASILRKAAERQAKMAAEEDLSSDEDEDDQGVVDDVDSDIEDAVMGNDSHELTQQQDFVAFST